MVRLPETDNAKKLLAAFWFAMFALLASALFFFHPPMAFQAIVLYVLLPGFSGAIAGYLWGGAILDFSAVKTYAASVPRGIGVTLGAYAIFAVLFAVGISVREKLWNIRQAPGLFVWTITLGFLMVGPFMLIAGSIAALTLRRFGRLVLRKNVITSS